MVSQESGRWHDYAAGMFVFCLILISGISIVLYGRFDIGEVFLFAGIATSILALLYNRRRRVQSGHLIMALAVAVLCAVMAIGAVAVLGDTVIHADTVNPDRSSSVTGIAGSWTPPDADLLGRELNDTTALLTLPVGGFEGGRVFVSSYSPEGVATYTLLARNMSPGVVELRVFPVTGARSATGHAPYEDIEVSVSPDRFAVVPGRSYSAQLRVNLTSGRYDNALLLFPYYIQARAGNGEQMIADDWVLVYAGGAIVPGVSGFCHGHASLDDSDRELILHAGETGTAAYVFRSGIGGTGFVQYNISLISGDLNMMPMPEEEKKPFPEGMQVTISPNNYTARSFGYYPSAISVTTDPDLLPGDYHILIEADGLGTNDQFVVRVVP